MPFEQILVIDDEPIVCRTFQSQLRKKGYTVSVAGTLEEAKATIPATRFDLIFLDLRLPDGDGVELLEEIGKQPDPPFVVMMTGHATVESAVSSMRMGAFDYLIKPFSSGQIEITIKKAEQYRHILNVARFYSKEDVGSNELLGQSEPIRKVRQLIERVARTQATVLIQGESGTGKELVANEIHKASNRASAPFIRVNCAAISETLIESEFFGHEKGAFTGATGRREGRFELADGGTILLDEISEISPGLQAKLLRVLQEREFERVGGNTTIRVDVRVIATTNRNLKLSVEKGDFREDLYYRLNVFPIYNPSLRERKEDIPLLSRAFVERASRKNGVAVKGLSGRSLKALCDHDWPGNVRELQNTIERAVIMSGDGRLIEPEMLGLVLSSTSEASFPQIPSLDLKGDEIVPLSQVEQECILGALRAFNGNRTKAANALGIALRTLRNKIREYRDAGIIVPEPGEEVVGIAEPEPVSDS